MEEEPLYNFSRLSVSQTLIRDGSQCTAAVAHSRFIALGTSSGEVLLVDPVRGVEVQRGKVHSGSVTGVAFDAECSWVGSCSEDGSAMVCKIGASEDEPLPQSRALQTICVPPDYARNDRRPVALGSRAGKVTVRWRPGHFNAESSKTYDMGAGPVRGMAWACNCLAWVQDDGVRIVGGNDSDPQGWKALIWTPPPGMSVHPEEKTLQGTPFLETSLLESCPPRLCWEVLPRPLGGGKAQGGGGGVIAYLHIAWGDTVQTVAIREIIEVEAPTTPFLPPPAPGGTPLITPISGHTLAPQPLPPQQPQPQQQQPTPPLPSNSGSSRSLLGGAFSSLTRTLTQTAAAMKDVATNAVAGGLAEAASAVNVAVAAVAALPASATGGLDSALKGNPVGFLPGMRSSAPVQRRELRASLVATGRVGDAWVAGLAVLDESFLLALTLEPHSGGGEDDGVMVESKSGETLPPPPPPPPYGGAPRPIPLPTQHLQLPPQHHSPVGAPPSPHSPGCPAPVLPHPPLHTL